MNEQKPSFYAVIPATVRYDKNLRANEKLLYGEISALTNKTGECWASNRYFADLYEVTPQAVGKWILNLEKNGYIAISYEYKANSKEIEKRIIKLGEVSTNVSRGINKCFKGYQQKFQDNNTSINNTSINNKKRSYDLEEFEQRAERLPIYKKKG